MDAVKLHKVRGAIVSTYQTQDGYRAVKHGLTWKVYAPDKRELRPAANLDEVRETIATVRNMPANEDPEVASKGTLYVHWRSVNEPDRPRGQAYAGSYRGLLSAVNQMRRGVADGSLLAASVTTRDGEPIYDSATGIDRAPRCQVCGFSGQIWCRDPDTHGRNHTPREDETWLSPLDPQAVETPEETR